MHAVEKSRKDSIKRLRVESSLSEGTMPATERAGEQLGAMERSDSGQSDERARSPFPLEDIVQHPLPGCVVPGHVAFSPDDQLITYLYSPDGTLSRKLFMFDPASQSQQLLMTPPGGGVEESNIPTAEKLRRERLRERGLGVTRYEWSKGGTVPRLLIPLPSGIYVQDGPGADLRLRASISPGGGPILDHQLAPNGSAIAYVQDDEIFVVSALSGEPQQITFGARGSNKTHGLAEYIAQEEMERRNGFWWSHDSRFIAYAEVDSAGIPLYRIMHQGKASVGPEAQEDHPYPFAGQANVRVRLGVVAVGGGETTWMDMECGCGGSEKADREEYLARVNWMPDGSLMAQVENRLQSQLTLLRFDPATGQREVVLTEYSDIWINLHDCFTPLNKGRGTLKGAFLWASERTGFRHLYLYDAKGNCLGPITEGEWMVETVAAVDENTGLIYFTGTMDSPLESHLYKTKLVPEAGQLLGRPERLTAGTGRHSVIVDHAMQRFVDVYDSLHSPPSVSLHLLQDGTKICPVFEQPNPNARVQRLRLTPPEIIQIKAKDGTPLYGALYRPDPDVFGPPPYRTVVSVYGGPHVQTVSNSWMGTIDMRAQYLRSRGMLVWKLDNRGSARRGLAFEGAVKNKMGRVDVEDQETGVQWLLREGLSSQSHIGIYGWSYGGYMAAMTLAQLPHLFRCAVSGAPVTSWDGYDTHYTERYMGLPKSYPAEYEHSSVMHHVAGLQGKLLLVHGMIDENVHFRHTARLINALTAAAKDYDLLLFPDERHMPRGLRDRIYMEERIFDFLHRNV